MRLSRVRLDSLRHDRPSSLARAIEGGRITIDGTGFPVDRTAAARGARRRRARARRVRVADAHSTSSCPPGSTAGGPAAGARRRRPRDARVRRDRGAVRDRAASGRQPGLRSRGQPLRHLQRHARPAGAGVDLPRAARTARAKRSRRASSTRRRWRSTPTAGSTCRAGSRAPSTALMPDGSVEPFATDLGVACGLAFASRRHAVCRRSIGHDLQRRSRRAARRRSRRCRRASPRFISRSGRTARCTSPGRRCRRTTSVYRIDARGHRDASAARRSAGRRGSRSIRRGTLFVVEALAGASGLYRLPPKGEPGAGARRARSRRRRLRSERRRRRLLERHRVSTAPSDSWRNFRPELRARPRSSAAAIRSASISVREIDHQADEQPQAEAHPRDPRQAEHQVDAREDAEHRHERDPRRPEGARPVRDRASAGSGCRCRRG